MAYLIDIATAVPGYRVTQKDMVGFYTKALQSLPENGSDHTKMLDLMARKTRIKSRYSCLPDFNSPVRELFTDNRYDQSVEKRTELYCEKIVPLATSAIDQVFQQNHIRSSDITHLVTVSCTGLSAPGLEFMVASHYGLDHTEKSALNFLGCYAAIKAIKHANYIAQSDPGACVLIVCAELCSLHFTPSIAHEDLLANLLFADGAAAALIAGTGSRHVRNKPLLNIGSVGFASIPGTRDLMTWNISPTSFRMFLSKEVVPAIRENIRPIIDDFLDENEDDIDFWAIHPGGIAIVEAVQASLDLSPEDVEDSVNVMKDYGNMSSPTILFILKRVMDRLKKNDDPGSKNIFTCAFGPGLSIEMVLLNSVDTRARRESKSRATDYVQESLR